MEQNVKERGIGVQVSGDGNTVTIYAGLAELALVRKHTRKAEPKNERDLFRVDLQATTLVGRDADRAALKTWLATDRQVSLRCITGRAGAGKTRLAIELCARAEKAGWTAGFVQYGQFQEFVRHAAAWRWNKPLLIVIDYAAALARELRDWIEILAHPEAQSGDHKLRLLLLERHAERDLGWWADLIRPVSFSDPGPDELADPPEPVPLPSLAAIEDRRTLLAEIMRLAAQIAGIQPIPRPPLPGADPPFDRRLGDDTIDNEPLYLMMAGAEAIRTGAAAALALSRGDLAERAANRERMRLNHLSSQWGLPDRLVPYSAMCVTLQGGCSAEEALRLVDEERRAGGFPETSPAPDLVNRLVEALPATSGAEVEAVRPDLIGEAFLLQGMQEYRHFPKVQTVILDRAWQRAGRKVTATLIRTAQDHAQGDAAHQSVAWLGHLVGRMDNLAALMALADELPQQTLALRELALLVNQKIAAAFGQDTVSVPELRPMLARAFTNLGGRLRDLGRCEAALAATEKAVAIHRELAVQRPDAFRPDRAQSLTNLGIILSAVGRRREALAVTEEAVAIFRDLAAQRPDAFRPDLARSLTNLGKRLSAVERRGEALAATEKAVAIFRDLAAQRPDAFRPNLARSLTNLGNRLSDLGRREEALTAVEEAVAIRRELAAQRPDAFRPDLAVSLATRANCLDALQSMEAIAANAAAIATLSPAFIVQPAAFSHWMIPLVRQYFERCKRLGAAVDEELLAPIANILRNLDSANRNKPNEL